MPPPSGDSGGGDMGEGPMGGESLPWPMEDSPGGEGLEELDEQLDDALGDFDDTVAGGSGAGEEEIDILNPMGGSSGSASDQPVFEEADPGGEGEGGAAENETVAQRASAGASGGESDSSGGQQSDASSSAGAAGASADGQQGNTNTGQGEEGAAESIPIPEDVGDGRNDDIVLRQIREAAMNEQDPVLREKLWDEYRRIRDQR